VEHSQSLVQAQTLVIQPPSKALVKIVKYYTINVLQKFSLLLSIMLYVATDIKIAA